MSSNKKSGNAILRFLQLKRYQYEVTFSLYMLTPIEKIIFSTCPKSACVVRIGVGWWSDSSDSCFRRLLGARRSRFLQQSPRRVLSSRPLEFLAPGLPCSHTEAPPHICCRNTANPALLPHRYIPLYRTLAANSCGLLLPAAPYRSCRLQGVVLLCRRRPLVVGEACGGCGERFEGGTIRAWVLLGFVFGLGAYEVNSALCFCFLFAFVDGRER
jgi:hypothetical protein